MSTKTEHHESNVSYFCTFTCNQWMNLFSITDFYDQIYKWFDIMVKAHYHILGYVIMPNHLHFIIHSPNDKQSLNKRVGTGKRFMAYEIVERLKAGHHHDILKILSDDVKPFDRRSGKLHHVFIDSFDGKELVSEEMLLQKLDYIHHNPVSGKWNLVDNFIHYLHSSAKFYETGVQGIYPVTHYDDVWK